GLVLAEVVGGTIQLPVRRDAKACAHAADVRLGRQNPVSRQTGGAPGAGRTKHRPIEVDSWAYAIKAKSLIEIRRVSLDFPALGRIKEPADSDRRIDDKAAGLKPCRFEFPSEQVVDEVDRVLHVAKKTTHACPRRTWNHLAISLAGWFYDPEIELIIEMEKRAVHRLQRVLDSRLGFGLLALGAKWVPKGLLVFVGGAAGRGRVLPCRVSNAQSRPEKDEQTCSQTKRFHSVSSMN